MHQSAKLIVKTYNGQLPADKKKLQELPGFGPYTTHAVLSLAFNQPFAVVDGNVKRVISRLYLIEDDLRNAATHKKIQTLMDELLPKKNSRPFNEAVMELGALICLPLNPQCQKCPISAECIARQKGKQEALPFLSKRAKIPEIRSLSFIIKNGNDYLLVKRPPHGLLAGLWEFPALKVTPAQWEKIPPALLLREHYGLQAVTSKIWPVVKHSYTHFHLTLRAALLLTTEHSIKAESYASSRWLSLDEIKRFPLHRAMWKVINMVEKELVAITD